MARVLITRAEPGAAKTAARLEALGHMPCVAPVLRVENVAAQIEAANVAALALTSANGARAAGALTALADIPAFCVGAETFRAAQSAGLNAVAHAEGNVAALAALIKNRTPKICGRILHLSAADQAGDLTGALRTAGLNAERVVIYRAVAAEKPLAVDLSGVDAILFHSQRGGEAFTNILNETQRAQLSRIDAICISSNAAQAIGALAWRRVMVAASPQEDAIFALLPRPSTADA
jgi:uroporphyrinogen-III synthase